MALLTDDQLAELGRTHKRVIAVPWDGHQLVFRRGTRDDVREMRRVERDAPDEAYDMIAQLLVVAVDGETDPVRARQAFNAFLEERPDWTRVTPLRATIHALIGRVEEEDLATLGKFVRIWPAIRSSSDAGSPSGSAASSAAGS